MSAGLGPGRARWGCPGAERGAGRARAARRAGGGEGRAVPPPLSSGDVAASLPPSGTGPAAGGCRGVPLGEKTGGAAAGALWAEQELPAGLPHRHGCAAAGARIVRAQPRAGAGGTRRLLVLRGDPALRGLAICRAGGGMLAGLSPLSGPCLAIAKQRRSLCAKKLPALDVCGFAVLLCVTSS